MLRVVADSAWSPRMSQRPELAAPAKLDWNRMRVAVPPKVVSPVRVTKTEGHVGRVVLAVVLLLTMAP